MAAEWDCPNAWPCENHVEHSAPRGCVHRSTYVPDAHDTSEASDQ